MNDLIKLVIGIFNPADSGDGEAVVNKTLKVLGTVAVVLGALSGLVTQIMAALGGS